MEYITELFSELMLDNIDIDIYLDKAKAVLKNQPGICCPVATYKNIAKIIAYIEFQRNNNSEALFYLISSHGIYLKTLLYKSFFTMNAKHEIVPRDTVTSEETDVFIKNKMENYNDIIKMLKEMPKEWTIVQLTQSYDLPGKFLSPAKPDSRPHEIHLVRMACGSKAEIYSPFEIRLLPKLNEDKFYFWKEMDFLIKIEMNRFQDKSPLLDTELEKIILFCEDLFKNYKSIFLGNFIDSRINDELFNAVQKIIKNIPQEIKSSFSEQDFRLLECVALGAPTMNETELLNSLMFILKDLNIASTAKKILDKIIIKYEKISTFKRNPVILITDQMLDCIPFEMLSFLNKEPITRGNSFYMTYHLFQAHKNTIQHGYKQIKNKGSYIITEEKGLEKATKRWKQFLEERLPHWKNLRGDDISITRENYFRALHDKDIYLYFGHGAGIDLFPLVNLSKVRINSTVFLGGCSTSFNKLRGENIEGYSPAHYYQTALAPCVVGSLWPVLDFESSKYFITLITLWCDENRRSEDNLLLVMQQARSSVTKNNCKAAFIAMGIPVKLCNDS